LATFKKTVAMHEVFLIRLANHPVFRNDHFFRVFLEYDQDVRNQNMWLLLICANKFNSLQLCVRSKNKKEMFEGLVKSFSKTSDELLLSVSQKDNDEFFEKEKDFLLNYHSQLKDATAKSDKMTSRHQGVPTQFNGNNTPLTLFFRCG